MTKKEYQQFTLSTLIKELKSEGQSKAFIIEEINTYRNCEWNNCKIRKEVRYLYYSTIQGMPILYCKKHAYKFKKGSKGVK